MIATGIVIGVITSVVAPQTENNDPDKIMTIDGQIDWEYAIYGENPALTVTTWIVNQAIVLAIAVYLIRRWSKEWNRQFEQMS